MPNIAKVLKEEIARISRKEAKALVNKVHKPTLKLRGYVADLKRRGALLEKEVKRLKALMARVEQAQPAAAPQEADRIRITAKGMRSLRRKLGLSQVKFAVLLGVSTQIVQIWEKKSGALRVRESTKAAIRAIRGLGARQAQQRLDEMKAAKKTSKRAAKKTSKRASKRRKRK